MQGRMNIPTHDSGGRRGFYLVELDGCLMPSQLSRQSVRLLTDWSQVRALSMALLGPQLSQVERSAHNRDVMGSNPIGPIAYSSFIIGFLLLRWCSPANHFGLSSRRLGFESRSEHFLYLKDFLGISFPLLAAGVSERPKETGLGPVDAGLPGFESLLPHYLLFLFLFYLGIHMPGQGRRSSYGTVDPVTRVQISAPAPFLNFFYYFNYFYL